MADDKIVSDDVVDDDIEGGEPKPDIKEGEPEKTSEDDDIEVPVRTATLQHIIARKNEKIKKLESKADDDDELTPEARTAVQREIDERMAPFRESAVGQETERLLNDLYAEEPDAKPFDKVIRKYMAYEKNGVRPYEHVPPAVIYHDLAFGKAESAGAKKKTTADIAANLSRTRGRGNRPTTTKTESGLPPIEEMKGMTDKEFKATMDAKLND